MIDSKLDDCWTLTKDILDTTKTINEVWKSLHTKDEYCSNLLPDYDIERKVKDAKSSLIRKAAYDTLKKYNIENVTIAPEDLIELAKFDFNTETVEKSIVEKYVKVAESKAYEQILKEAKELVPYGFWEHGKHVKTKVEDVLKKDRLKLRVFWSYERLDYRAYDHLRAFEKLVSITINNSDPSKVQLHPIHNIASVVKTFEGSFHNPFNEARSYVYDTTIFEGFRLYKNGKVEFKFKKAEDARKVAEVLVGSGEN